VTCSSDFCVCFSDVLEALLVGLDFKDIVELDHSDIHFDIPRPTPSESAVVASSHLTVAMGKRRTFSKSIFTGKSFWLFRENISYLKKTCISTPA
jgi:hypothetical protein